eukprot:gene30431-34352_t
MARAAGLLAQGRLPVGQIAEQVGYQSEAAFNRVFKRCYGIGPGGYRRSAAPALVVQHHLLEVIDIGAGGEQGGGDEENQGRRQHALQAERAEQQAHRAHQQRR